MRSKEHGNWNCHVTFLSTVCWDSIWNWTQWLSPRSTLVAQLIVKHTIPSHMCLYVCPFITQDLITMRTGVPLRFRLGSSPMNSFSEKGVCIYKGCGCGAVLYFHSHQSNQVSHSHVDFLRLDLISRLLKLFSSHTQSTPLRRRHSGTVARDHTAVCIKFQAQSPHSSWESHIYWSYVWL